MKVFITLADGRVDGLSYSKGPNTTEIEVPDDHEVRKNPYVFKYVNGELVKDTLYQQERAKEEEKKQNQPSIQAQISALKKQNSDLAYALMLKGVL